MIDFWWTRLMEIIITDDDDVCHNYIDNNNYDWLLWCIWLMVTIDEDNWLWISWLIDGHVWWLMFVDDRWQELNIFHDWSSWSWILTTNNWSWWLPWLIRIIDEWGSMIYDDRLMTMIINDDWRWPIIDVAWWCLLIMTIGIKLMIVIVDWCIIMASDVLTWWLLMAWVDLWLSFNDEYYAHDLICCDGDDWIMIMVISDHKWRWQMMMDYSRMDGWWNCKYWLMVLTDCGWLRWMIDIDNGFCCNFEYYIATGGVILFIYALFSVAPF